MPRRVIKKVRYSDEFQKNYQYELVEPEGKNFDPEFTPDLTPKQMLKTGIFGGSYFVGVKNGKPKDLPASWFVGVKLSEEGDKKLNCFGVLASQSLAEWKRKRWIVQQDPHGWFQWYCRYYLGRRTPEEDTRQIKRWKAFRRHASQVKKNCKSKDLDCRPRQRQALLHWGYDSREI